MTEETGLTGNTENIDVDSLMDQINNGQEVSQAPEPAPAVSEFEFEHNGKQIKVPYSDPKLRQWVQQGYDYPQRMAELNQQRTKWDQERQDFEKRFSPYKTIDEYAKQNPEWWNHVENSWQNKPQGTQIPDEIKQQLSELNQFKQTFEQSQKLQVEKQEDAVLEKEVHSIREQYKNLDWDSLDSKTGMNLEQRVLDHAMQSGIKSFRAAFRDYNYDHLVKLSQEHAKEDLAKENQKRTKLGLLGSSSTPIKGIKTSENIKTKSYDDLLREAKEEAGIA